METIGVPQKELEELIKAAEGALSLLTSIQADEEGQDAIPWPESDALLMALDNIKESVKEVTK